MGAGPGTGAIARAVRALEETAVVGVATTIGADLAVLRHPDFAAVAHSTNWVSEHPDLAPADPAAADPAAAEPPNGDGAPRIPARHRRGGGRQALQRVHVGVPDSAGDAAGAPARRRRARARHAAGGGDGQIAVGMQGTIVRVLVAVGDAVSAGDPVVVLEAMKMENHVTADSSGDRHRGQSGGGRLGGGRRRGGGDRLRRVCSGAVTGLNVEGPETWW